ncbi:hypothetical protein D3C84_28310 [compost metagenome]
MIINGMFGLGDNLYERAFIKALPKPVYLSTPWPFIFHDIPGVHFIRPQTNLRTQAKNIARHNTWTMPPTRQPTRQIRYGAEGIIPGMIASFGVMPGEFDLPPLPPSPESGPYVVVRPATVRSEWRADTRNPDPEYIAWAAAEAMRRGYRVISVADLVDGQEWGVDPMPPADVRYHKGELLVEQLLALVKDAAAVIGGIGWLVPAALAARVPAWIICGGQGGFNSPKQICPDGSTITFAVPDNFCGCRLKQHNCDKRISNYDAKLADWAGRHLFMESI